MNVQALDVISVNIWGILFSLVNLVIMFFIIKRFLFKPVCKVLDQRKENVSKVYSEADEARKSAENYKTEYEQKLSAAKEETREIIKNANERANAASDEILSEANKKASEILKKADEDIAFEKKKAINDIKNEISDMSINIAEEMIVREINEKDHRVLIDNFIDGMGNNSDKTSK